MSNTTLAVGNIQDYRCVRVWFKNEREPYSYLVEARRLRDFVTAILDEAKDNVWLVEAYALEKAVIQQAVFVPITDAEAAVEVLFADSTYDGGLS